MEETLTKREQEVLRLLAGGYSNLEIAEQLGISPKTVDTHLGHAYAKLGVRSRAQAILKAQLLALASSAAMGVAGDGALPNREDSIHGPGRALGAEHPLPEEEFRAREILVHDLHTALALAVGYAELLAMDRTAPGQAKDFASRAAHGAWAATRIARRLLGIAELPDQRAG